MKLVLVLILMSLTGCASMATILKGAGDGITHGSTNRESSSYKAPLTCTPTVMGQYSCQ